MTQKQDKVKEYKEKLERLGITNPDEVVKDVFSEVGYLVRLLFWYWHWKEIERMKKDE